MLPAAVVDCSERICDGHVREKPAPNLYPSGSIQEEMREVECPAGANAIRHIDAAKIASIRKTHEYREMNSGSDCDLIGRPILCAYASDCRFISLDGHGNVLSPYFPPEYGFASSHAAHFGNLRALYYPAVGRAGPWYAAVLPEAACFLPGVGERVAACGAAAGARPGVCHVTAGGALRGHGRGPAAQLGPPGRAARAREAKTS